MKRYRLPPLDLILGFEAAARTLSFTKAADELALTQSAMSRQIRALEDSLGVALFERRTRALALTSEGRRFLRTVDDVLDRLQEVTDRLKADRGTRHLTVSTTTGFATLWLIPRLKRFTSLHPEVDVRISATMVAVALERGAADIAVRYCRATDAPAEAIRLFGEEVMPVCSPQLFPATAAPRRLEVLAQHTLLHMDSAEGILDWETWLTAEGLGDLRPAASLRFDNYDQLIQAALAGHGVALGIRRLVQHLVDEGRLVIPFDISQCSGRAYYILRSALTRKEPHVDDFIAWLRREAETSVAAEPPAAVSSRPPGAPSTGASRRAR